MSANPPSVVDSPDASSTEGRRSSRPRLKWILWGLALAAGIGAGAAGALLHRSGSSPAPSMMSTPSLSGALATWPAGTRPAPDFLLTDQHGAAFSLHSRRGRPVIVTFIDPLCRNLCPLEAKVLSAAERQLAPAARPPIVAVSVNPWGDSPVNFNDDAAKWKVGPEWRWGAAGYARLARVWRQYEVAVRVTTKTIAGVTVHEVAHTEAAYIVDGSGHERALYVYPFRADDIVAAVHGLEHA
jgi:cytochrome oxidase Cu insertion factor (SCO1/SenC/PrrC family)